VASFHIRNCSKGLSSSYPIEYNTSLSFFAKHYFRSPTLPNTQSTTTQTTQTINMQFSVLIAAAFAAVASAQYSYSNGTTSAVVAPSGTAAPSGTGAPHASSTVPFEGAAPAMTGAGAMLFAAGAAALVRRQTRGCFDHR
jgi:hypothetical protein